jgi:nucleotide-binding universal stress UspA family protein
MSTIQRVLFAVDFSPGCQVLVPTVRRMIESWQSEVTLLHVIEAKQWLGRKHELERLMASMSTIAREGLGDRRVTCRLERGAAGERILEYIRAKQVDLAVISAGNSSGRYGGVIGSVADQVLAEAPCSVWLDWGAARFQPQAGMYARRVACALTDNASDEFILRQAEEVSGDLSAGLTVIQAVSPPLGKRRVVLLWDQRARDAAVTMAKRRIEALWRPFLARPEVAVEVGSHHAVVSRIIQSRQMGLLVTGDLREGILAAQSECPVLRLPSVATAANRAAEPELRYAMAAGGSA